MHAAPVTPSISGHFGVRLPYVPTEEDVANAILHGGTAMVTPLSNNADVTYSCFGGIGAKEAHTPEAEKLLRAEFALHQYLKTCVVPGQKVPFLLAIKWLETSIFQGGRCGIVMNHANFG
jgi:hypothetical protein